MVILSWFVSYSDSDIQRDGETFTPPHQPIKYDINYCRCIESLVFLHRFLFDLSIICDQYYEGIFVFRNNCDL